MAQPHRSRLTVVSRRVPEPTRVFRTYWKFAAERQRVFRARLSNEYDPSSVDPILRDYKFTNAYRASDRTSQFLIRHVIYDGQERDFRDSFARVILFKFFNRIETWTSIEAALGTIEGESIDPPTISHLLDQRRASGQPVYSAAYIMPSPSLFGSQKKHENHLRLLRRMLDECVPERIQECPSMSDAYEILRAYPSVGPFLAYQLITDLNYTPDLSFSEHEFVVPGPGAVDGLRKCFSGTGGMEDKDLIQWTMERQEAEFGANDIEFCDLWGRPLQLIDCQNLFCEVDKYARVAHPEVRGESGRKRIKQRFRPRVAALTAWYPPKWGINDAAQQWIDQRNSAASPAAKEA